MRLGQPKEEKRTWPRHLLSLINELSPDYELNKLAKGCRTECLRELVPGGVLVSHNTFCLRGCYYHCFGLALSPALSDPYLHSPYFIGGRFDHNLSVSKSFMSHMNLSPQDRREREMSWHDSHQWRVGADDIVRRCTKTAEQYLLPFYLGRLATSVNGLLELLEVVGEAVLLSEGELQERSGAIDLRGLDLGLFELTSPEHAWQRMPVPEKYYALAAEKRDLFLATRDSIPRILGRLKSVCGN